MRLFTKKNLPLFITAISVVLIISIVAIVILGGKNNPPSIGNGNTGSVDHTHSFAEWTTVKQPNCIENGTNERYCACGEKQTQTISAYGHTEVIDKAITSTCETAGKTEGKHCSKCNTIIVEQISLPLASHTYDNANDEKCNVCNYERDLSCQHINTEIIKAVESTCTTSGLTEGKKCADCEDILIAQVATSLKDHTPATVKGFDSTCTQTGLTDSQKCSACGTELVPASAIPVKPHEYTDKYDESCNKCGFIRDAECAHTNTSVIPGKNATCTEAGLTEGSKCTKCGETLVAQSTIQSNGHRYNTGEITAEATCNQSGIKKFTCLNSGCNHSYTESYSLQTYSATELYNLSVKYVGEIVTYDKSGTELALGTGFVISSDGKIVTNYHVIEGAYTAEITINNQTYTISSILAYDANIDLAVLKINATGLTPATICKQPISVGSTVYAIGSSRGLTNTYSQGIVTYYNRIVDGVSHIQHDASITHGNSGGPLINVYGEVVGINTWGISDSQNLNFAVFTAELDNLVYGTPMTLAEFYESNNNAFDILIDFILANGEYDSGNGKTELVLENGYNSSRTEYHIVQFDYDPKYNCVDLTHYVAFTNSDVTFFTGISIEKNVDSYYWAIYVSVDGSTTNKMSGYIDYETFTDNTLLGYTTYEGKTSQEASTRENASLSAIYLVEYLDWLANNYLGVTISDFGFKSFSVSNDNNTDSGGNSSYAQYQEELNILTTKYNSDVSELQDKILDSQAKIESCQKAINNARSQLASLSPTCPQWFLQQYINNWQAYGSTGAATVAAQNAWAQEYNNQRNQLNNSISINTTAISGHQANITLYTSQIDVLTNQYNANVNALKAKYGIT